MRNIVSMLIIILSLPAASLAEPVRGAYPSANVQFLPAFVALEKGFYKREGLDPELISVRNAVTAVQALLGNQIHFIFSVGPQMPSIWEGADIILLAMEGQPPEVRQRLWEIHLKNVEFWQALFDRVGEAIAPRKTKS